MPINFRWILGLVRVGFAELLHDVRLLLHYEWKAAETVNCDRHGRLFLDDLESGGTVAEQTHLRLESRIQNRLRFVPRVNRRLLRALNFQVSNLIAIGYLSCLLCRRIHSRI